MNLIINTVGGQLLTLTPEMLQEKLGLKSDILSLGIEVSDDNTAITAQSYTKWECAGDTICPLIDVNVKNGGKEMQAAMFQLPTPEIPAPFCRLYDEQGSDEFAFATANLCMTGSCLRAAPFFVPFSLHILANRIDWYLWRCFHH